MRSPGFPFLSKSGDTCVIQEQPLGILKFQNPKIFLKMCVCFLSSLYNRNLNYGEMKSIPVTDLVTLLRMKTLFLAGNY